MLFLSILFLLGVLTGGVATIVGFGIGSFLTPILALRTGFGIAVAAVAVAHFFGSALRYMLLKQSVNPKVLVSFGLLSAAGGLAGALLQAWSSSAVLAIVFGGLMVFAGVSGMVGWAEKVRIQGPLAWVVGAVSGFFGGLVGNQGGLRAAGLMGFRLGKTEFVATATAVALIVDGLRVPVYLATQSGELYKLIPEITSMSLGVIFGTLLGTPLIKRLPERQFKVALSVILIIVGVLVALRA